MNEVTLFKVEWNCWNGFLIDVLYIDSYKPVNVDSALLGINFSREFLYIKLFFVTVKIYDNER